MLGVIENITKWRPNTKRHIRRPKQGWIDRIKENLRMIGSENTEEVSRDRKK